MTDRTRHILELLHECSPAERHYLRQQLNDWPTELSPDLQLQIEAIQRPPVPDEVLKRFNDLLGRHLSGRLNEDESQEFERLIQRIEALKAQHTQAIADLATALGCDTDTIRERYLSQSDF